MRRRLTPSKTPLITPKASASHAASFQRWHGRRAADQLLITRRACCPARDLLPEQEYPGQGALYCGANLMKAYALQGDTLIKEENGSLHVSYAPEPPLPEPVTRPKELYINGELLSKWDE